MVATGETVGLAEWIIDDTSCSILLANEEINKSSEFSDPPGRPHVALWRVLNSGRAYV